MLTAEEKRAVLFLAGIAALGGAVRIIRSPQPAPAVSVAPELRSGDVQRQVALARREAELMRPLGPGETVDVDRASTRELERLPGVGPSLAQRIVADREANGAFGSLAALDGVPGVGPAVLASIRPFASFSGPARPVREPQAVSRLESSARRAVGSRAPRSASP